MYVKKSVLVTLMLVTLTMILYILVDHRMIMASDSTEITAYSMDLSAAADAGRQTVATTDAQTGGKGWQSFEATAYSTFGITRTGVWVQRGIIAVDPSIIPLGSIVELRAGSYTGLYTAMDTGGLINGHIIDIYMPSLDEAVRFGRQKIQLRVIRKGWNPGIQVNESLADGIRVVRQDSLPQ